MKKAAIFAAVAAAACVATAAKWNLDESKWYSGPKLTEADLVDKVVFVDMWGVHCGPCKALLPSMQKYWSSFKAKNFVLIGSHCQGREEGLVAQLVKENGLTYPIYDWAGLAEGAPKNPTGGLPFMYVVNHRGKVVYAGNNHHAAITAAQEAILAIGQPPSLVGGLAFDKKSPYRGIDKQLVIGKNIASVVKRLESDIKKAGTKSATPAQKAAAKEAEEILAAISEGRDEAKAEIEEKKSANPEEALKLMKLFMKTFPKEGAEYKEELPALVEKAKAMKAAAKPAKRQKKQ